MKAVRTFVGLAGLAAAVPAMAALSPQYQRPREMAAIASDVAVIAAFPGGAPIDRIEFLAEDLYRVSSGKCRMDVRIEDEPTDEGWNGGRRFRVVPGEVICEDAD